MEKVTPELLEKWGFSFNLEHCPVAHHRKLGVYYWHQNPCNEDIDEFWIEIAEELKHKIDKVQYQSKKSDETITDGYSVWSKTCPSCEKDAMVVVRPGKVQCNNCL